MPCFRRGHAATLALALMPVSAAVQPVPAFAATSTGSLGVSVQVQDVCSVDGGSLDFGAYSGGQTSALEAVGSIRYLGCSAGDLSFSLDGGSAGNEADRRLSNGNGGSLAYELYRNSGHTQAWGSGPDAMNLRLLVPGSGEVPVYGRIPGGQDVPAGSYTDAVNVTLTF